MIRVGWAKFNKDIPIPFHRQAETLAYCTGFTCHLEALYFCNVLAQRDDFLRCVIELEETRTHEDILGKAIHEKRTNQ